MGVAFTEATHEFGHPGARSPVRSTRTNSFQLTLPVPISKVAHPGEEQPEMISGTVNGINSADTCSRWTLSLQIIGHAIFMLVMGPALKST